ncbi:MAG: alpha-mannosidase, partial [Theionarchaea archaeon]|nr:alpha-mannosidase [Theionarchaea archaeon]
MKPKIHMIGNAHLDPVWLWVWQDGLEVAQKTCRDAVDLLDKHPGYKFSRSSAAVYKWVESTDPELFSRIKEHVGGGRWNIVNGWWVQPDCNIPCGESLVRQGLYGQLYFKERFGRRAKVGFNVDTFGHCGTLPQILRKLGLNYYVFMRPDPREKTLPSNLFWWQSPDGSRVLTDRIDSYGAGDLEDLDRKFKRSTARSRESGLDSMCFYGHGDHGGGPTEEMVKKIEDMKNEVQEFVVDFSTPDEFFQALESHLPEFPVVVDDLQHHSRGCYTVVSDIKRANRMLESSLVSAEKFCSMASLHLGVPYPREILRRSWETLLFHQFHDIMGGTSIKPAYDDASKAMRMAKDLADSEAEFAMEALSARIDTAGDGRSILVFNPSPCPREDPIRFEAILPGDENLVAFDESGTRHPLQVDSSVDFKDEKMVSASFIAGLPPIGYRVFWIREGHGNGTDVTGAGNTVENSLIRISVDPDTGYLCSVFDKTTGTEYLKGPSRPILIRDDSDTWSHDVV